MIKITVTITSDEDGIELRQEGSAGDEGASDEECMAADIISSDIHQSFNKVKQEGDIEEIVQPYTRIQKRK